MDLGQCHSSSEILKPSLGRDTAHSMWEMFKKNAKCPPAWCYKQSKTDKKEFQISKVHQKYYFTKVVFKEIYHFLMIKKNKVEEG